MHLKTIGLECLAPCLNLGARCAGDGTKSFFKSATLESWLSTPGRTVGGVEIF